MYKKILCLMIICLLTGCKQDENLISTLTLEENKTLETTFKDKCEFEQDIYYQSGNKRLFLNCVDNILVIENQNEISLKDYLDRGNDIDEVIDKLILNLNDHYESNGNDVYTDDNTTIISCSDSNRANEDYLIGKKNADNDLDKACVILQANYEITATITEVYDDMIIVENVSDNTDKYAITRTTAFEKNTLEKLKTGAVITFTYTGGGDFSDPPQIRAISISVVK